MAKGAAETTKRVAIYLRVSTTGQTTANQQRELEAVANRHGWEVVQVFADNGVSGAKGRKERPGLDALLKGVARRDFDMVAAWSVDRLGRSLQDLIEVLSDLHAKNVDLYLHQQGLDTSTPSGRAMFQMMGVFAELSGPSFASACCRASPAPRQKASHWGDAPWSRANRTRSRPSRRPSSPAWACGALPVSIGLASARCFGSGRRCGCNLPVLVGRLGSPSAGHRRPMPKRFGLRINAWSICEQAGTSAD
jgi:hypothetical protein